MRGLLWWVVTPILSVPLTCSAVALLLLDRSLLAWLLAPLAAILDIALQGAITSFAMTRHANELRTFVQRFRTHQLEPVPTDECFDALTRNGMDIERSLEEDPRAAGPIDKRFLQGARHKGSSRFCVVSSSDPREKRTAQLVTFTLLGESFVFLPNHPRSFNRLQCFQFLHELGHISYTTLGHMLVPTRWVALAVLSLALPLVLGFTVPVVVGSLALAAYARTVLRALGIERLRREGESDEIAADLFAIRCAPRGWVASLGPSRERIASLFCTTRYAGPRRPDDDPSLATRRLGATPSSGTGTPAPATTPPRTPGRRCSRGSGPTSSGRRVSPRRSSCSCWSSPSHPPPAGFSRCSSCSR